MLPTMLQRRSLRAADSLAQDGSNVRSAERSLPGRRVGTIRPLRGSTAKLRAIVTPAPQLRVRRPPLEDDTKRERRERWLIWGMSLLSALTLVGWIVWSGTAERRAIARMPVEQRRLIYEHTLESVRAMCADRSDDDIRQRCREQAEFLLAFPECRDECQKLIDPMLRHVPTR